MHILLHFEIYRGAKAPFFMGKKLMTPKIKKILITVGIVLVAVIAFYSGTAGTYNQIVDLEENVTSSWSQVQNVYQRRLDLIPNLVETVKAAAGHEEKVFTEIAEARSRAGGVVKIDSEALDDPETFKKFQKAQDSLSSAIQRLLVVTENYPDLKVNTNFQNLQVQLEGTENRISVERKKYNDSVKTYNSFIRKFPKNIIANMNGFRTKSYFEASEEAQTVPQVKF